jgi:predicted HTH transcriptional regulator
MKSNSMVKRGAEDAAKVTKNREYILNEIAANGHITIRELASKVGISERKVKDNIAKLKQVHVLKRVGTPRSGHWEVKSS